MFILEMHLFSPSRCKIVVGYVLVLVLFYMIEGKLVGNMEL
jgi:hypothetical protein